MESEKIKKNLLDLEYNKNLQYLNTCIVLLFTYFIGIIIAIFTNQINYNNWRSISLTVVLSLIFLCTFLGFVIHFRFATKEIKLKIRKLKL
ncbi:hypothetical protein J4230_04055 [Candidatus Woesearchaeota archaeon]|nr:hypothetical protein [Candidatus Woesearchaeota archaeon]